MNPNPQLAMWSAEDPVTLFRAAVPLKTGRDDVSRTFRWLASRWSSCTDQRVEIVAAGVSGNLGYTVGFEHTAVSLDGVPAEPYTLRVTQIYRRENGEWKVVHRRGDAPPVDPSLPGEASTAK